jgi:UDP-2,3-diacylglucosamine hydrolase
VILGDCHLAVGTPERTRLVLSFLQYVRSRADRVIILGDFFDFWLGPKHLSIPDYQPILNTLQELTRAHLDIGMIPGNRDFLVDDSFSQQTGVRLLRDFEDVTVGPCSARLTHGDMLCSRDRRYHLWRRVVRNRVVYWGIANLPLSLTRPLAVYMRNLSARETHRKTFQTLGFVEETAVRAIGNGPDALIAGHNHRPEVRPLHTPFGEKRLYVLGDWKDVGIYIRMTRDGIEFRVFTGEAEDSPLEVPHRARWDDEPPWDRIDALRFGKRPHGPPGPATS